MQKAKAFVLLACASGFSVAQTPARPGPSDPKAAAPVHLYESAFKDYRPFVDPEIARWRDVNDEVGRLGSHVGHVPQRPGTAAKPGAKPPAQSGHGEHK